MNIEQKRRVVIVTGASRGLGREIAVRFGASGDRVVVNYRRGKEESLAAVKMITEQGGEAVSFRADVSLSDDVDTMVNAVLEQWGSIDVLVNNAGIVRDGLLVRMNEQEWDEVIHTNLYGSFYCIRSVSNIMMKQRNGHIISIGSLVGLHGREGQANYSAAKAGLIGLTRACARELGSYNIKVNAVLPGYLQTDMGKSASNHVFERAVGENMLGRISDPTEIADFVYYLSTMENVSGQVFNLDSRIV
jgi:3-oxoacyl-[acyl-carrier protein] reductase